jgi:IS5 family transposase
VDAESGLVHTVRGTAGSVNDVVEANSCCTARRREAFGDAGYQGAHKRPDAKTACTGTSPCGRASAGRWTRAREWMRLTEQLERWKASIRAKVEHPFRVIKRQFGHVKVRYRGLAKNTAQLHTLFALANLWMVRRKLDGVRA